jgi:Coenzyme PQQ synthesis protein D (PqqD)
VPELSPETIVARRPEPLTAEVHDELVMLDPRQSAYFGLDRIGKRVWELLERPQSVNQLCGDLKDEFDVTFEDCRADVLALLEQLREAELLEVR